jgi:hypothetical protein
MYLGDHVQDGVFMQQRQSAMTAEQFGRWAPLSLPELLETLATAGFRGGSGGYALDLLLGRTTRRHEDFDVETLRRDQRRVQACSQAWTGICMSPPAATCGNGARAIGACTWHQQRVVPTRSWQALVLAAHACRERQPQLGVSPQPRHPPTTGGGRTTRRRRRALSRPDHPTAVQG